MAVSSERMRQIEELYHAASERPHAERELFLAEACVNDPDLLRKVAGMLGQETAGVLDQPVINLAANVLGDAKWAAGMEVGHYEIISRLGDGGMGAVYKARDTRLKRFVAIKRLHEGGNAGEQELLRFRREAQAASALNHANIVHIYGLESLAGADCIVMEFTSGRTLAQLLAANPLSIEQSLDYAIQIATGLAAAHTANIVHRDIKPANIIVTNEGAVKILDFGLAKLQTAQPLSDSTASSPLVTKPNTIMGTAAYMSPEQAEGKVVDARSDIFSTGATLYEMFSGKRAFDGDSMLDVLSNVLRETPVPVRSLRPEIPKGIEQIIDRCLKKDVAARYASGVELAQALASFRRPASTTAWTRRTTTAAIAALAVAMAFAGWMYNRYSRIRWTRNEAIPQIRTLIAKDDYPAAFDLARAALNYSPDDPDLKQLWSQASAPVSLTSTPPGAKVFYRPFGDTKTPWKLVGTTPFENVAMPGGYLSIRIEAQGREPQQIAAHSFIMSGFNFTLIPEGQLPAGMVAIPEIAVSNGFPPNPPLPSFFIDKYEVTNVQFKKFIDDGGYRNPKNWRHSFRKNGGEIPFQQALAQFRDGTGREGPAGWVLGAFPKEQADFPVSGVSWYEAAAYCESAGKSLPTVRHWRRAAGFSMFAQILLFSNFNQTGPARVGSNSGTTPFGVYDMAGNVKEWTWNAAGERRAILGGGWNEPSYMFQDPDAQDPFTRGVSYGFRCAKYIAELPPALMAPMQPEGRDYAKEKPADDKTFETFRRMFAYDKTPLESKTESRDDSSEFWRREKISFRAVYGGERMFGYLYSPRNAKPPFQTVIWAPGGYAHGLRSSETGIRTEEFSYLLQTGRAIFYPVYKTTYERRLADNAGENSRREGLMQYVKDVFQSVDFLESRPEIDHSRIAYYGISSGTWHGVFALALEPRIKTGILNAGGLLAIPLPPEVDALNFAPRLRMPVLMVNGRYDFAYPVETSQKPLFRLLGTPEQHKRHALFDGGHVPPVQETMREVLAWLDKYLGPVEMTH